MERTIAEYDEIKKLVDAMAATIAPQKIYLFGSFAKGLQKEESDYDFYIVIDDGLSTSDIYDLAFLAIRGRKRPVDILVKEEKKFNERATWINSVEKDVVQEGVVLYERRC